MSLAAPAGVDPRDDAAMRQAIDQARNAWLMGEVPVGAVLVREVGGVRQVVASGFNRPVTDADPSAHAEIVALRAAGQQLGNYRFPECELFVTLEPCAMCAMALLHARVKRVVWAAPDPKAGANGSVLDLFAESRLNHHTTVEGGLLAEESAALLRSFFAERREAHRLRRGTAKTAPSPYDGMEADAADGASPDAPAGTTVDAGADGRADADADADARTTVDAHVDPIAVGIATEFGPETGR